MAEKCTKQDVLYMVGTLGWLKITRGGRPRHMGNQCHDLLGKW